MTKPCPWLMYLRKSRADGEESVEQVLARHESILQEYALGQLGHSVPEDLIFREVVSGETIQDRPQMQRVLGLIQTGAWAGVLVVDPQRLSRGDLMDCGIIIRSLQYSSTAVITPQKTYDLSDKFDRKFLEMELMRGSDYLEYTKEILARGRLASVKAGYFVGSRPPYGYDKVRDGKRYTLSPNADADHIRLMFALFVKDGLTTCALARRLDALGIPPQSGDHWTENMLRDLLRNPVYAGKIRWNWKKTTKSYVDGKIVRHRPRNDADCLIVDGRHPALVDEATFAAAQQRFGHEPRTKGWAQLRNPLAALLYCGGCGRAMSLRTYHIKGTQIDRAPPRLICNDQTYCHTRSATYREVEEAVVKGLQQYIGDFTFRLEHMGDDTGQLQDAIIQRLKKELEAIETRQTRLYELLESGVYDKATFLERNAALAQKRKEAADALSAAEKSTSKAQDYTAILCRLKDAVEALLDPDVSADLKNQILRRVIRRIDYTCTAPPRVKSATFSLDIHLREDLFSE